MNKSTGRKPAKSSYSYWRKIRTTFAGTICRERLGCKG